MYPQGCGGSSPFFGTSFEVSGISPASSFSRSRVPVLEEPVVSYTTLGSLLVGMQARAVLLFHLFDRKNFAPESGELREFLLDFQ